MDFLISGQCMCIDQVRSYVLLAIFLSPLAGADVGSGLWGVDSKYAPIYGDINGYSVYLHYCLPGFSPEGEVGCGGGLPGKNPRMVQVEYKNSMLDGRPLLEGGGWFEFPFPVNADVQGKTLYTRQYEERARAVVSGREVFRAAEDGDVFPGLAKYESNLMPEGTRWWVIEDLGAYKTRLGNPYIFLCNRHSCTLTLDVGCGWEAQFEFAESVLSDWQGLIRDINSSTAEVMVMINGL